jgi:hypothetical protein
MNNQITSKNILLTIEIRKYKDQTSIVNRSINPKRIYLLNRKTSLLHLQ